MASENMRESRADSRALAVGVFFVLTVVATGFVAKSAWVALPVALGLVYVAMVASAAQMEIQEKIEILSKKISHKG